jgi:hypothetical protein
MTDPPRPDGGDAHAFDQIREQAEHLLQQARAADPGVFGRLRELLPRLASLPDAEAAASIQLADV